MNPFITVYVSIQMFHKFMYQSINVLLVHATIY